MTAYDELVELLMATFPSAPYYAQRGGLIAIECYIDDNHLFDVCIVPRDYPGLDFDRTLTNLFDGHVMVSETDGSGNPTARHVLQQTFRWPLDERTRSARK